MKYLTSGHGVYYLKYHIVWVTKYRRRILKPGVKEYAGKLLRGLLRGMPGVAMETIGFDLDHLHMVMLIPPKYAVSDVVAQLKSQSASRLRQKFLWLHQVYWKESVLWSPGFFASTVGLDEGAIKRYVEHQGRQDSGQQQALL
jgi:putative transposase